MQSVLAGLSGGGLHHDGVNRHGSAVGELGRALPEGGSRQAIKLNSQFVVIHHFFQDELRLHLNRSYLRGEADLFVVER